MRCSVLLILVALLSAAHVFAAEPVTAPGFEPVEQAPVLHAVRFEGLARIEPETVRLSIASAAGQPLDRDTIAADIRRLYALGYFNGIRAELEQEPAGSVLVFKFVERPMVRSVTFSGNEEIENEKIEEKIDIKPRTMLDENKVRQVAEKLRELYAEKGYNFTQISPEIEPLPNNEVALRFRIEENLQVRVSRVNFVGNRVYSDAQLKDLLETKEDSALSFITSTGVFKESALRRDVELLTSHYLDNGYIKVRIDNPKAYLSSDRKWVEITYKIEEGPQYFVGTIRFPKPPPEGDLIFKEAEIREKMKTQTGLPFSRSRLGADVQAISERYQDIGFAFVSVSPLTDIDEERRIVNLNFQIDKGSLVYINQIRIRGNTKTRDKVIRRELLVVEGQLFDGSALRRSRERVFALGFFDEVNFSTQPAGPEKIDVVIEVKERSTGTLSVGVGFNSLDRFLGIAQVSFGNLLGYGIRANLQAELGAKRQFYTLSYTDPYFLDSKWSLGGDLFNSKRDFIEYFERSIGGALNAGYLVYLNTRVYLIYRYEDISLGNFVGGGSEFFKGGASGSIGASINRNTKNHPYDPSAGYVLGTGIEWAEPYFGGENHFVKYNVEATYFYDLFLGVVFSAHAEVAWGRSTIGGRLPFTERYFLGGITSLRGFNYRQVGPRVSIPSRAGTDFFQPISIVEGGNKMLVSNNEIVFPIIPAAGIKGVVFFDAGNAYAEAQPFFREPLRMGTGFGLRWFSPIGPLRFEWGYPIKRRPGERPTVFEFSIGTFF